MNCFTCKHAILDEEYPDVVGCKLGNEQEGGGYGLIQPFNSLCLDFSLDKESEVSYNSVNAIHNLENMR